MADLQPIQFKRSKIKGKVPTSSQLLVGEIAINFADQIIYTKDDSDNIIAVGVNYDSDLLQIKHDFASGDSDILVILNAVIDSDLRVIRHNYLSADSDLRSDIDSDGVTIRHDFKAADSDLRSDIDSDGVTIRHDFKAADSDLLVHVQNILDSDLPRIIHDSIAGDSDLNSYLRSEVVRVLSEEDSDNKITRDDHDSDFLMTYHDFRAADSDFRVQYDSDIPQIYHDYKAGDSDLLVYVQNILDSDLPRIRHDSAASDSDLRADIDSDGVTIRHDFKAADSDLLVHVQNILDSDLPDIIHDYLANDSDQVLSSLNDVSKDLPEEGFILAWDSDSELWKPKPYSLVGPGQLYRQQFFAIQGQTNFGPLVHAPKGDVVIYRNGIALPFESATFDHTLGQVVYDPAGNFNNQLDSDDDIIVDYMYSSSVEYGTRVADLWDVSSTVLNNEHHDILTWDSDQQLWIPRKTVHLTRRSEQHFAVQGQTKFVLDYTPTSDVLVARNGIIIPSDAFTLDSDTVTYIPANNANDVIDSDDDVIFDYFTGENAIVVQEAYLPSTPSDWNGTAPTTTAEAIDRIAAAIKALNGTGA